MSFKTPENLLKLKLNLGTAPPGAPPRPCAKEFAEALCHLRQIGASSDQIISLKEDYRNACREWDERYGQGRPGAIFSAKE